MIANNHAKKAEQLPKEDTSQIFLSATFEIKGAAVVKKTKYVFERSLKDGFLLVNLLTFNYLILNKKDAEKWQNNDLTGMSCYESLVSECFVVKDDSALFNRALNYFAIRGELKPSHVVFITDECNQHCPYCFEKESGSLNNIHRRQTMNDIEKIFHMILEINGNPVEGNIILFGGEPLLSKNISIIKYCFELAKQYNFPSLQIVTNGTQIRDYKELFSQFYEQIGALIVTLNGSREVHDVIRGSCNNPTFDVIINNIKYIVKEFPNISIQINLLLEKRNIDNIDKLLLFLKQEGILEKPQVHVLFGRIQSRTNPLQGDYPFALPYENYYSEVLKAAAHSTYIEDSMISGSEVDVLGRIYKHWKKNMLVFPSLKGCEAVYPGRYCYYVDGNIYPCTEIVGKNSYAIGSFSEEKLFESRQAKWGDFNIQNIKKCMACKYVCLCGGACPVTTIEMNSAMDDPYCLKIEKALSKMIEELDKEGFFNGKA